VARNLGLRLEMDAKRLNLERHYGIGWEGRERFDITAVQADIGQATRQRHVTALRLNLSETLEPPAAPSFFDPERGRLFATLELICYLLVRRPRNDVRIHTFSADCFIHLYRRIGRRL
jgi:hypothetical protein